jgi:hypothetical protein
MEAEMRAVTIAFVSGVALAAMSAQATPLAPRLPSQASIDVAPPTELVAEGGGWGWHRVNWQDHWGYWHWHCVSDEFVQDGYGTSLEHPYSNWRGPTGGFGNP